jgi:two-component system sensor histidine kinase YesM
MFLMLALVMMILTLLMGVVVLFYLYRTVEKEVMDFNGSLQKFATDSSAATINRLISLTREVSYDSMLIEQLYEYRNGKFEEDFPYGEISEYLENKATNNIWVTYPESNLITLHMLYVEGDTLLSISPRYSLIATTGPLVLPMKEHQGQRGVEQYSFLISNPISDPVNGDFYGYILLDVSEKVLYDSYKDLQSESKVFVITDKDGMVLSAKDKNLIGDRFIDASRAGLGQRASGYLKAEDHLAILFYQQIGGTEWYLVQKTDIAVIMASLMGMRIFIILLFLLSMIVMFFILIQFRNKTAKPVVKMNDMLDAVASGDLSVRAEIQTNDEFGQMAQSFNTMVEKIESLLTTVTETEKAKRLAELDFLRAQINPHFIYNTLSSIRFSIEMGKTQDAREMLFHFTKLLRSTLNRSDQFISLREELDIIDHYVNVQSYRYPGGFMLKKDLDEKTLSYEVPSFILQPLVENAIFHNEGLERTNIITIGSRCWDSRLLISIDDNGFGMNGDDAIQALTKKASLNKIGLQNVQERIQLNYGSTYGLTIESKESVGTTVLITIPARIYNGKEGLSNDENSCG